MIRYRCPHCAAPTAAHERRLGQSSVCKTCLKTHPIPSDESLWLTESGALLHPPAPAPVRPIPALEPRSQVVREAAARPAEFEAAAAEAGGVATADPPAPVVRRTPRTGNAPPPYGEPVHLQTQADIAMALTAAITARMKPAQAPRRDLRPSTAVWLLLTGVGVAFVLAAVLNDPEYRWAALTVGAAQVAVGYAWIVWLTSLRHPLRALACAVPPATFFYLARHKYAGFRPLRFVLTGAALAGLSYAAPQLADLARPLVGTKEAKPAPDPAAESRLARLRAYRDQRDYTALIQLLEELAKTDPTRSVDAADRVELSAEMKALCAHSLTDVRLAAMYAYALWDVQPNTAGARGVCLAAIRSPTPEERLRALELLPRWKDAESARAVRSLIGPPSVETNRAKASLEEIGGAPAEQAALALLKQADGSAKRLTAIEILKKVGGPEAAAELRTFAMKTDESSERRQALAAAAAIEARTPKP